MSFKARPKWLAQLRQTLKEFVAFRQRGHSREPAGLGIAWTSQTDLIEHDTRKGQLGTFSVFKATGRDDSQYWATLAHETAHASRHESRLNRDFGQTRFGDAGYALEELVAELASAFIGAHIGLPADHLEDHASYIDGWLKALGDNPSSFLTAASKAQATADWVLREMGVG